MMLNSVRATNLVLILFACSCLLLVTSGCSGPKIPEQVPLTVVILNAKGKPLNNVNVQMVPQQDGLDGSYIAEGTTDKDGRCEMNLSSANPGVPACRHKVQITEGKASADARQAYMSGDPSAALKEKKARKNRPIPEIYTRLTTTPLIIDVDGEQPEIELKLDQN